MEPTSNANQGLLACETVFARLDAALASANAEIECTRIAETRMRRLVSRLESEHGRPEQGIRALTRPELHFGSRSERNVPANDNPRVPLGCAVSVGVE